MGGKAFAERSRNQPRQLITGQGPISRKEGTVRTRRLELLRPDEVQAEMARCPLVYWPVGPLEWHGPHLPLGTDPLHAEAAALRAAAETGGLVFPTFYWGTERERSPEMLRYLGFEGHEWVVGMDFPSNALPSAYAHEEMFALLVRENLRLIVDMGFRVIVILSGHAAANQMAVLERLTAEFNASGPARVLVALPFVRNDQGILEVGHASSMETSAMMALHPQSVDLSRLPPPEQPLRNLAWAIVDYPTFMGQPTSERTVREVEDPRLHASPEEGRRRLDEAVAQLVERIRKAMEVKE